MAFDEDEEEDRDHAVHPIDLADIRLRLERGEPGRAKYQTEIDVIKEIRTQYKLHRDSVLPLLDVLIDVYRAGKLEVGATSLAGLYIQTRVPALLDAICDSPDLNRCSPCDKCILFEDGVASLKSDLLTYLWENWQSVEDPWRPYVAAALGKRGDHEALAMLETIHRRMKDIVSSQAARLRSIEDLSTVSTDDFLNGADATRNGVFLSAVEEAIRCLRDRGVGA